MHGWKAKPCLEEIYRLAANLFKSKTPMANLKCTDVFRGRGNLLARSKVTIQIPEVSLSGSPAAGINSALYYCQNIQGKVKHRYI